MSLDRLDHHRRGSPSHFIAIGAHAGKRWDRGGHEFEIVEAGDQHLLGNGYLPTAAFEKYAQRKVVIKHVLKNALIPVVTLIGPIFAIVATGSFFVEKIFNVPGMGKFYVESMQTKDQTMILAVVLIFGVFLAVMNILVDIVYALIDPRIRY